jgi:hypothetical protein
MYPSELEFDLLPELFLELLPDDLLPDPPELVLYTGCGSALTVRLISFTHPPAEIVILVSPGATAAIIPSSLTTATSASEHSRKACSLALSSNAMHSQSNIFLQFLPVH